MWAPYGAYWSIQTKKPGVRGILRGATSTQHGPVATARHWAVIAHSGQAQCQSAQMQFCILVYQSLQDAFNMYTKAICKHTTRCSQFYHLCCYATEPW